MIITGNSILEPSALNFPVIGFFDIIKSHDCPICNPNGNHTPISAAELFASPVWKRGIESANLIAKEGEERAYQT